MQIWQAALATSAASAFFDSITVRESSEKYDDGAEVMENATSEVWSEAQCIWPWAPLEAKINCLLSIGTGIPSLGTFTNDLVSIALNLPTITSEPGEIPERFRLKETGSYYRFNVIAGIEHIRLDRLGVTDDITAATDRYIDSWIVFAQLKACGKRLSEKSSA